MVLNGAFNIFVKAKLDFAKTVGEAALKASNMALFRTRNALGELKPLLNDLSEDIKYYATIAVGRIAKHDYNLAKEILKIDILPLLLTDFKNIKKRQKCSVFQLLNNICKHGSDIVKEIIDKEILPVIVIGLEDFDLSVKESAALVISSIVGYNQEFAQTAVDKGVTPLLKLALNESPVTLKIVAATALGDIAKHNIQLARTVVEAGAIAPLVKNLENQDARLKLQILFGLSSLAKHTVDLAEIIVETEVFPSVFLYMAHQCQDVRKNATVLVRDVVKHTLELTQLIVGIGGIAALIKLLNQEGDKPKIPCVIALGYIAGHSDQLAMSVIGAEAISTLGAILKKKTDDALIAVTVWTLGQIGKHSPEHVKPIAEENLFPLILQSYASILSSQDMKYKCKSTLKLCLQKCLVLPALEPLLYDAPSNILKYVLGQYSKLLPNDPQARRLFVTTGSLKRVQNIEANPGTTIMEYITIINSCFPEEIVRYYSPGYPETLLDKVEQYTPAPQMAKVLQEDSSDSDVQQ